mmetsp:Transcript_40069/g.111372  ORF Transcript_40069/g.111372 Transcript_40069/m.111372 type:complete len:341 (-) Transcript_40069:641-1663(-)
MKLLRRLRSFATTLIPPTKTIEKHISTRPPTTQIGIEDMIAPNLPMTPNRINQQAHAKPAARDAQRVSAMTPLFCEKVVFGGEVKTAAKRELMPSASRPPCTLESKSSPLTGRSEASHERPMSPTVSAVEMKKPIRIGRKYSGAKPRKVSGLGSLFQRNVMVGAASILSVFQKLYRLPGTASANPPMHGASGSAEHMVLSPAMASYDVTPEISIPNRSPKKSAVDFRNGEPTACSSVVKRMTDMARPMYSGAPYPSTTSPFSLHSCGPEPKAPCLLSIFSPQNTPPPTYLMPELIRPPPISITAEPVTTGGKIFLMTRGGSSARNISKSDATMQVPRNRP